jgi:hypothetical protein
MDRELVRRAQDGDLGAFEALASPRRQPAGHATGRHHRRSGKELGHRSYLKDRGRSGSRTGTGWCRHTRVRAMVDSLSDPLAD